MDLDADFMAEIEEAAARYQENIIFTCFKVDKRQSLISELTVPDNICSCWSDRSTRYAWHIDEKKHYFHLPCGKISRWSIWFYCAKCSHIYFDDRSPKGQETVNGMLCPCCDGESNGSTKAN